MHACGCKRLVPPVPTGCPPCDILTAALSAYEQAKGQGTAHPDICPIHGPVPRSEVATFPDHANEMHIPCGAWVGRVASPIPAAQVAEAARTVVKRWGEFDRALTVYFAEFGVAHVEDCAELAERGDECDCAHVRPLIAATPPMRVAIEQFNDADRIAIAGTPGKEP